jgi:hypothetical protein
MIALWIFHSALAVSIDMSITIDREFDSVDHVGDGTVVFAGRNIDYNPATVLFGDTFVETLTGREGIVGRMDSDKHLLWHRKYSNSYYRLLTAANTNSVLVYSKNENRIDLLDLSGSIQTQFVAQIEDAIDLVDHVNGFYLVCFVQTGDTGQIGTQTLGSPAGHQIVVISFDNNGNINWINEDNTFTEYVGDLSAYTAPDGSLGVTGYFSTDFSRDGTIYSSEGSYDMFVFKYNKDGSNGFSTTMGDSNNQRTAALAIGATGAYYITGWFNNSARVGSFVFSGSQYTCPIIIKLDPQGNVVNAKIPSSPPSSGSGQQLVAHWPSQSLYWIGVYNGSFTYDGLSLSESAPFHDDFIIKLDENLNAEWAYGNIFYLSDGIMDSAIDNEGSVYIAGAKDVDNGIPGRLVKLDPDPAFISSTSNASFTIQSQLAQSVSWQAQATYIYQPQYSYDLEVWTDIGGQITGDDTTHTVYFTPDEPSVFYRVVRYDD